MKKTVDFLKNFAWPFGLAGGVYAIVSRFIPADATANLLLVLAIAVFLVAVIITQSFYLGERVQGGEADQAKIEVVMDAGKLFVIDKTDRFGLGMAAHVYYKEDAYERLIAVGQVINVQTDGKIQIKLEYEAAVEPDLLLRISQNTPSIRQQIKIRPAILVNIADRASANV